jgi:hypothetical protein
MRNIVMLAATVVCFASCSGWDGDSKKSFHSSCVESMRGIGKTEAEAKSACDCRLELVMKKYPGVEEALENIDKIASDPEIAACK